MKKEIIKRMGALLCALVVLVGCFDSARVYAQDFSSIDITVSCWDSTNKRYRDVPLKEYIVVSANGMYFLICGESFSVCDGCENGRCERLNNIHMYGYTRQYYEMAIKGFRGVFYLDESGEWCSCSNSWTTGDYSVNYELARQMNIKGFVDSFEAGAECEKQILYISSDIVDSSGNVVIKGGEQESKEDFDINIGYLQNISHQNLYLRDSFGNYLDNTRKDRWLFDLITSTGVDLSSGNYVIRHYVQPNLVDGYKLENIIEQYDKYLVGEYDASGGVIEYLRSDLERSLASLGYDGIGFVDAYLRGRFILEHHLFQIVDASTGGVGPLLRVRPNDEKGTLIDSVEDYFDFDSNEHNSFVADGLTPNGEIDVDYVKDYVDRKPGSGNSYEDAIEQAQMPNIEIDFSGVDVFSGVIKDISGQINNVSSAIGSLISAFPPWVATCLGVSFGMLVVGVIIRVLKG